MLDPVAVALKFGFLAVLYLFLLWVARSALRDLRGTAGVADYDEATGMHPAGAGLALDHGGPGVLRVDSAPGFSPGSAFEVSGGLLMGRSPEADVRLQDQYSSSHHARLVRQGEAIVLEDLGSTNGTYLNGEPLGGPQPLHDGDRIRIGDSEFTFER